jgi:putative transposase
VIVGVTARGQKRFLAIADGVREATQSRLSHIHASMCCRSTGREVLLSLKSRGMNAPKLAVGPSHRLQANDCRAVDGAMGFWAAMDEVYPTTHQQRCWQHKTMNVLNCLPKLSQPKAKAAIHNIWQAETKDDAEKAFDLFIKTYEPKYPKATLCLPTLCLQKDRTELMAFFDFPAQHWQSIRTSNPIESAFATIRHQTKRSKGCLSRDGMLHMMFKLGQCSEQNWRKLCGFDYLAKVITGVTFKDGIEATNPSQIAV